MKTIPPFPAKGQGIKCTNLERNALIIGSIIVFALLFFVAWATHPYVGHPSITPTSTPIATTASQQEQFNIQARQLRDKAIEQTRK